MDITYLREHPYLIGSLYFFGIWIVLFILNKKDKKEQLVFGIIGGVLGVLVEQMHLNDWWRPNFIYDFPIHIEDIFFGIGVMGISSVLYEFLFKKKQKSYSKLRPTKRYKIILFIVAFFLDVGNSNFYSCNFYRNKEAWPYFFYGYIWVINGIDRSSFLLDRFDVAAKCNW